MSLLPLLLLGMVGGAVAYAAQHKAPAAPQAPAVERVKAALDPHMPEPLAQAVAGSVVASTDARALATLAAKVEPLYPIAAAVVATRVTQLFAAAAATVPTQAAPGDRLYHVAAGDTPLTVAERFAGRADPAMVRELAASNPTIAPRITSGELKTGEVVKIPSSWLGTSIPSDTPIVTSHTYAVQKGDSPSAIAKKITGSSSAAKINALAAANGSKKARILSGKIAVYNPVTGAGDLLVIPESWRA